MKKKQSLLWVSEVFVNTGFARVSESLLKHLNEEEKYEVTVLDTYRAHPLLKYDNYSIIGRGRIDDDLSVDRLGEIYNAYDKIFIIQDIWNIQRYLKSIKARWRSGMRMPEITIYFPIDAPGHNPDWYEDLDIVKNIVTYTNFAKAEIQGIVGTDTPVSVIPHGVDFDTFHKLPETRNVLRRQMFDKNGLFDDKFIFLNANRNQPRKRLDITLEAFAEFAKDKDNALLYMHCGPLDESMNLYHLAKRYGITEKMMLSTNLPGMPKMSKKKLNLLYNCCNVGLNSCMGEGWGLTNIEHAVTGAPQIVPAHTALKEIYSPIENANKLLVEPKGTYTFDHVMTVGHLVSAEDMAVKMQKAYSEPGFYMDAAISTLKYFKQPVFEWKNISAAFSNII